MRHLIIAAAAAAIFATPLTARAGYFDIFDDGTTINAYGQSYDNSGNPQLSFNGSGFSSNPAGVMQSSATVLNFAASAGGPANYNWLYVHAGKVVAEYHVQTVDGQFTGSYKDDFAIQGGNYSALADAPSVAPANTSVLTLVYEATAALPYYSANSYYYNNDTWSVVGFSANLDLYLPAAAVDTAVPEPASMALFGLGAAVLGFARRRRS